MVPAGTGQTEMQVSTIRDLGISSYVGTPSFLKLIVEKADEIKADISCLKKALVGAEYLPPALRSAMQGRGIQVLQMYGTADLGLIAYETHAPDGSVNDGMILEESLILEIVRPGTGDPVAPGEVGELVTRHQHRLHDNPLRYGPSLRGARCAQPLRRTTCAAAADGARRSDPKEGRDVARRADQRDRAPASGSLRARLVSRRDRRGAHDNQMEVEGTRPPAEALVVVRESQLRAKELVAPGAAERRQGVEDLRNTPSRRCALVHAARFTLDPDQTGAVPEEQ